VLRDPLMTQRHLCWNRHLTARRISAARRDQRAPRKSLGPGSRQHIGKSMRHGAAVSSRPTPCPPQPGPVIEDMLHSSSLDGIGARSAGRLAQGHVQMGRCHTPWQRNQNRQRSSGRTVSSMQGCVRVTRRSAAQLGVPGTRLASAMSAVNRSDLAALWDKTAVATPSRFVALATRRTVGWPASSRAEPRSG
jgi:hypothetical protein